MAIDIRSRVNSVRVAFFAASAVFALSNGSVCSASCGEYLYSRFHMPTQYDGDLNPADQESLNLPFDRLLTDFKIIDRKSSTPQFPCDGPGCQQAPSAPLPMAPPGTVESGRHDRLLCGHLGIEQPSLVSERQYLNSHARARRGFPLLIEMPPECVGW